MSQENKDNLNTLYQYYNKYFISVPKYLSSLLDFFLGKSDEIKDGFLTDIFQAINEQTNANTKAIINADVIGKVLTDNKDFMDNVTPLATSILQRFTTIFNHLRVVDLSHNTITDIPSNLSINPCIESFDMSYNQLTTSLPSVQYF
ncbi:MAG: hypothetical protein WCP92_08975 [bacterium]